VSDEARQVFDNVRVVLEQSGSSLSRVLKMTILMTDMSEFSQINDVVNEYFPANPPARASIAVLELPKGARVVVELIAATNALVD
jgi:reactive intermediate/imine deaminase